MRRRVVALTTLIVLASSDLALSRPLNKVELGTGYVGYRGDLKSRKDASWSIGLSRDFDADTSSGYVTAFLVRTLGRSRIDDKPFNASLTALAIGREFGPLAIDFGFGNLDFAASGDHVAYGSPTLRVGLSGELAGGVDIGIRGLAFGVRDERAGLPKRVSLALGGEATLGYRF